MENTFPPLLIAAVIGAYFLMLIIISHFTSRKASNLDFFLAGRESPWYLVAFGMVGASLSGVTFISIPGVVGQNGANQDFSYMQMVLGYFLGYVVIAQVLMPLYYRMNLTSIYSYLEERLGIKAYKTGAAYFLISRIVGASFRLYLVAIVLQEFVMNAYNIPFYITVGVTIILIWIYTHRAGIKTIVYTDTVQTLSMLAAVVFTVIAIGNQMDLGILGIISEVRESDYSQMFFFEGGWEDPNNFFKQFISGALITVVMTGLDQDMMQKNLSCRNIREAQMNMYSFSIILILANVLFLALGALLYIYSAEIQMSIPEQSDKLFPMMALTELPVYVGVVFVVGLIAAAYSSADSALTSLTTSFCIDFLDFEKKEVTGQKNKNLRKYVHIGFSVLLFAVIVIFNAYNNDSVINQLFKFASYTYGPLLGLFLFGITTRYNVKGWGVVLVCIFAPVLSILLDRNSGELLNGFQFGYLILAVNGALTFAGLFIVSKLTDK